MSWKSRPHVALEVADLAASVAFYRSLFGAEPVKIRPGYAKFSLESPALNLALNQNAARRTREVVDPGAAHFGVEVRSPADVTAAGGRLSQAGLLRLEQKQVACCYARQDKVWAVDPDGNRWEVLAVTEADLPAHTEEPASTTTCCPRA